MPLGLIRFHESKQTHFITFSCYRRLRLLSDPEICDLFLLTLEQVRVRFGLRVYGYVLMPEHVHVLISEPDRDLLADAMRALKQSLAKRARGLRKGKSTGLAFWQKRYYDHNVDSYESFVEKLRYIHRNPVKRGLCQKPEDWPWSTFRHYSDGECGPVEIESEHTARKRELAMQGTAPR